ncbi:ribonuclease P protein component [Patescibacteria group bacterium]|nr:ribonuclease P protein component [Patescibacteria group bacterium]
MLKKVERISSKKEFAEVKNKGEMKAGELFSVIWMNSSTATEGQRKFGAIISKKISKKAVERNQIRRRLFEAVRNNMEMFPQGFRGIFLVKRNILDKKMEEIEKCLKRLF